MSPVFPRSITHNHYLHLGLPNFLINYLYFYLHTPITYSEGTYDSLLHPPLLRKHPSLTVLSSTTYSLTGESFPRKPPLLNSIFNSNLNYYMNSKILINKKLFINNYILIIKILIYVNNKLCDCYGIWSISKL